MKLAFRKFAARLRLCIAGLVLPFMVPAPVPASPVTGASAKIAIWRLDCGGFDIDISTFSDTFDYARQRRVLVNSCYLIRHGERLFLWDTGLPLQLPKSWRDLGAIAPKRSIVRQLADIGVTPDQIGLIGISHWHPDHMSQAADFPGAKLMIGAQDWEAFRSANARSSLDIMQPWLSGKAVVEPIGKDKDVFGDGRVVMLSTPGHTAGHHSLMVRLDAGRTVILTGDLSNMRESYDRDLVQSENVSRADTLASLARLKAIARRFKATVIVQHEAADVGKLPAFPRHAQ